MTYDPERDGITPTFFHAVEMFGRRGHAPLKGRIVTERIGPWVIVVNATAEEAEVAPPETMGGKVGPVSIGVWFNGWWAGEFNAAGGWFAAGSAANEAAFLEALKEAS